MSAAADATTAVGSERHFCVLLEKEQTFGFLLPESTYDLTFLHATKPITIVTRQHVVNPDGSIAVPTTPPPIPDAVLTTHVREYCLWTVPDNAYRVVDCKDRAHSARDIVDSIVKHKVVYIVNPPTDSLAALQNVYTTWTRKGGVNAGM